MQPPLSPTPAHATLGQSPLALTPEPLPYTSPLFLCSIPAGFPSPATDYIEDGLDLNEYPLTLDSFFQGTENLTDVLEVVHYSRSGMLQRLSELSLYWSMLPDAGVPNEQLYRWFKPAMAEACIATVNDQPLKAAHIAELVWWLIGYRLPAEQYEPLAGNIDFVTIQKTIQSCCMVRSQRDQAVTQLAVMQALYAAVQ